MRTSEVTSGTVDEIGYVKRGGTSEEIGSDVRITVLLLV